MLSELLEKLEREHGIDPSQGQNVLNTIAQHIKEKFPMVGGMLDKALGTSSSIPSPQNTSAGESESPLQQLEDLAKSKLGGLFGH